MMPPPVRVLIGGLVFALWILSSSAVVPATGGLPPAAREALAVIVNRRNPVESVSSGELRRIFLLETQQWQHGRRITVVHRDPGDSDRVAALRLICRMSEADYERYLLQETFRGNTGTAAPRYIRSAEGMRAFVFNAPGAIGYLRVGELDASVKALRIDGRLPTEPEYSLREGEGSAGRVSRLPLVALDRCGSSPRTPCRP